MKNDSLKHGFRQISEREIKEISSFSRRFIHEQSGAELLHFENTDKNKTDSLKEILDMSLRL